MNCKDLKIEIVPLTDSSSQSRFDRHPLLKSKGSTLEVILMKTLVTRKKKDKFEARHMFQLPSGNVITAFERGSTTLQAKKRLMRLLGLQVFSLNLRPGS